MLKEGIYEQVINTEIADELNICEREGYIYSAGEIVSPESSKIFADYISDIIKQQLHIVLDKKDNITGQVELVNRLIETIKSQTEESELDGKILDVNPQQLLSLLNKQNTIFSINKDAEIVRPETSIAQSSLFTGAVHEPQMFSELKREIASSDRIDMLVSFIKWSGLRLIIDDLLEFTRKGGKLRIITTSYMGATDYKAIERLSELENTTIKVSYDTKITRLHAKSYVFYRNTEYTTAYVGSSNMSNAALSSGLEWNLKIAQRDQPETIQKINATFQSYWNSSEFELYDEGKKERLKIALNQEKYISVSSEGILNFDIRPYTYQQEVLDKLEAERQVQGYYRNLVVAATGTGKTVISAFDYKRFKAQSKPKVPRLLFIAHREEILKQSLYTFRHVLRDNNFGELFVGNHTPDSFDNLFVSIQTYNSQGLYDKISDDYYDYIVIDEFHHAASSSYQKLLSHHKPTILLGLTATPERMDGKSILSYFDNRIAAEIRLPEAIDRKLLSPFQYFGVSDDIDLSHLKWSRGGYDKSELSNLFTFSERIAHNRALHIIESVLKYTTDIDEVKGLGFCVSIEHAKYMADVFNEHGISSIALVGSSGSDLRNSAKKRLIDGEVKFIFVVDIYNEGVDIPEINTVLFLRPSESLTIFLQQLGRGLRLCEGKECLTVLDFIGQANSKYRFENKFSALLTDSSKSIQKEIKKGFTHLPKGCYIHLEKKSKEYILSNIKASFSGKSGLVSRIASFEEDSGLSLSLSNFLDYYNLDVRTIYAKDSFSRLSVLAGVKETFCDVDESILFKALQRICLINSRRFIAFILRALSGEKWVYSPAENRMLQMLQYTVWLKGVNDCPYDDTIQSILVNPTMCNEMIELLEYQHRKIDFVDESVEVGFDCPLDLHCTYSRDQILVAMDFMKPATVREGVKYIQDKSIDLLFVTLNKSEKDYSPTTMYNDYSINEELFHWQSQSGTSVTSPTGLRYINQRREGNRILLFVRDSKKDTILGTTDSYTFLGAVEYVEHSNSKPINITWKLNRHIPAKFYKKSNKLMVV